MRIRSRQYVNINKQSTFQKLKALTVLAGENGSGKSRLLRDIAAQAARYERTTIAISNSAYHRFNGFEGMIHVLAPRRKGSAPESVLKSAIRSAQEQDEIRLRSISRVLRHCGYSPSVGMRLVKTKTGRVTSNYRERIEDLSSKRGGLKEDLVATIFMLDSMDSGMHWMNFDGITFEVSKERKASKILFWELELVELGLIRPVRLHLHSADVVIGLREASSGEIALITSVAFIAASANKIDYLLIDEPENSLHPQWQRDYVDLLMGAIGYSRVSTVIATHSPLIVMGTETTDVEKELIVLSKAMSGVDVSEEDSLDAVMSKVFMLVTPKSHFLSRHLIQLLNELELGNVNLAYVLSSIEELRSAGPDRKQMIALEMVEKMAHSVERRRGGLS